MSLAGVKLHLVETLDDVDKFREWMARPHDELSIDTETGGFDHWRDPLRMVQIGDEMDGWALPWPKWQGVIQELFGRLTGDNVMHNAKFDTAFMEVNDIPVFRHRTHDSRIAAALYDNVKSSALKSLAARLIDHDAHSPQEALASAMRQNGWTWSTVPWDLPCYWEYSALDTVLTQRVWNWHKNKLGPFRELYDMELAVQQILTDMERRGIRVDLEYCHRQIDALEGTIADLEARAEAEWGVRRLGSDQQVIKRLQQDGVVFTRFTDKGRESLDEESLSGINHPLAAILKEHRHAVKISGTYFENYLELADGDLLHPSVNSLGAKTGRMSVSRPSMQNLERSALVRDAFIPREDHVLLLVDYDTIEYRLFAHYAGMEEILEAARAGVDMHMRTAQQIYQTTDITKDMRSITKNATYAKLYGAGSAQFARTAKVSETQGDAFISAYDTAFPEVTAFQHKLQEAALRRKAVEGDAYIVTNYGRRLSLIPGSGEYMLVNYLIQGTAADVLKDAMVQLDLAGLSKYLLLPVHDELVFDIPRDEVDELEPEIINTMTIKDRFACPLTVDAQRVDRWGDKYR